MYFIGFLVSVGTRFSYSDAKLPVDLGPTEESEVLLLVTMGVLLEDEMVVVLAGLVVGVVVVMVVVGCAMECSSVSFKSGLEDPLTTVVSIL